MRLYRSIFPLIVVITLSCTKSRTDKNPQTGPTPGSTDTGVVTGTGAPLGSAVTKTIGTEGGSLVSDDQRLTVYIPSGAKSHFRFVGNSIRTS